MAFLPHQRWYYVLVPELPEVEVLVRYLGPLLRDRTIKGVHVRRAKVVAPASSRQFGQALRGAKFTDVSRRGKFLLFTLTRPKRGGALRLIGHLGMTGRMYLLPARARWPKHAAVVLDLGPDSFILEDTRYFGRLSLDGSPVMNLGPEPLGDGFDLEQFAAALARSRQPIKVKLLDQSLVAGVGNIYASEALFRARISPNRPSQTLRGERVRRLWRAIRVVLTEAIEGGSTVPLSFSGVERPDRLFYFGRGPGAPDYYEERLRVYDRAGQPCAACGTRIRRLKQAGRSTYYCPRCQR